MRNHARLLVCSAAVAVALLAGCGSSHKSYVRVPLRAQQTNIVGAYDLLHRLGFRVKLTRQTAISSLREPSAELSPRAGTRVARGSTIRITPTGGPIASPAVLKSNPRYRVPDFTGEPASAAIRWADDHRMFWSIPSLPVLQASDAPHLFDAYRVVAQQPKPGETIAQGVMVGQGFRPTPLTLTVVQKSESPPARAGLQSHVRVRIALTTYTNVRHRHVRTFTLGCRPVAGTLPLASRVCVDIARHPVAMLDPPPARTTCSPPAGSSELTVVADANGSRTTFGGVPDCDWPGGVGLAVYYAAITRDVRALGLIEPRLHCDENPALLLKPTPWRKVEACLHTK